MDNHEHLVENVIELVKKNGAYHLDCNNPGIYRQSISCSELVSDEELKWLFHMANYVVYGATMWQDVGEPNIFAEGKHNISSHRRKRLNWKTIGQVLVYGCGFIVGVVLMLLLLHFNK